MGHDMGNKAEDAPHCRQRKYQIPRKSYAFTTGPYMKCQGRCLVAQQPQVFRQLGAIRRRVFRRGRVKFMNPSACAVLRRYNYPLNCSLK